MFNLIDKIGYNNKNGYSAKNTGKLVYRQLAYGNFAETTGQTYCHQIRLLQDQIFKVNTTNGYTNYVLDRASFLFLNVKFWELFSSILTN